MKVQVQDGALRLRLDEAALATLLDGAPVRVAAMLAGRAVFRLEVRLAQGCALAPDGDGWRLQLPVAKLRAYAAALPRREALVLAAAGEGGTLRIDFEVDVRDSRKQRGRPASARSPARAN